MAMVPQLWTLSGLEAELGANRRKLGQVLAKVAPDEVKGARKKWLMRTAVAALHDGGSRNAGDEPTLEDENRRLARERAGKAEMDNAVRRGELVEKANVDAAVIGAFTRVRARLLALPSKAAPIVTQTDEPAEAEAVLRQHVTDALRELSETDVSTLGDPDRELVEKVLRMARPGARGASGVLSRGIGVHLPLYRRSGGYYLAADGDERRRERCRPPPPTRPPRQLPPRAMT